MPQEREEASLYRVAVPVPLPEPLTYRGPEGWPGEVRPGTRVRVPMGSRRLTGVVVGTADEAPEGVRLRRIAEVLDLVPVLTPELLDLARFTAEYYLSPLGEVLRSFVPPELEPWGRQKLRITDRGALASPRSEAESAILEALREHGSARLGDLAPRVGHDLAAAVDTLRTEGKVVLSGGSSRRRGSRYRTAWELAAGSPEELEERAGQSRPGREAVRFLAELGRPAATEEITEAVGCGPGVVRRLGKVGVLRRFTEIRKLGLDRQLLHRNGGEQPSFELRPDQHSSLAALRSALEAREYRGFLLQGMTGSGKTEVYLRAARTAIDSDRGVLLLVPEIALVPALARDARERFGPNLAVLHSSLSRTERAQEWERIRSGEARVVLGARSALFAPVRDLGLVVVDEEQDAAYKQDSTPRYNGRDLALVRASAEGAVAVLVSATPSLESRYNVEQGKLAGLRLTHRAGQGSLPEGILVDLRAEAAPRRPGEVVFSQVLRQEIDRALANDEQVILLRNRRGYAPILLCRACGEEHECDACGLPRTYHRRSARLVCHYCGSQRPVPSACESCGEEALEPIGAGTERVEERFVEEYPGVPVAVLDRDAVRRPGGASAVLGRFSTGEARVLIGTQMVSKGHHFPQVALAGVLAADSYLGFPDFRAVERTYTLLTQLAGRAGRGDRPGRVVVQTYHPDHYAIQAALNNRDEQFAEEEMRFRRIFHYPPYTRMVNLLVRGEDREEAERFATSLGRDLGRHPASRGVRIAGPAPAPFERLRNQWRFQIVLRGPSGQTLRAMVRDVVPERPPVDLVVDVDPQDLL